MAGVLSMVCNRSDYFSQPDQMKYGNGIGLSFYNKNCSILNMTMRVTTESATVKT